MPPTYEPTVDVIVPIHNQRELVEPCLTSVFEARNRTASELVVVDDASTDPALKAALARLAQERRITLLTNERNLGFTQTVNRGMRLHPCRDVVLLNSDTLVFGDWLDRLRRAAHSAPNVGTANPLTNGSPISGYPFRQPHGDIVLEISDAELDGMAVEVNAGRRVQVHYTVGFCVYICRAVLDAVGLFDAVHFPVGYGEEADFCYRARKVGWRHVVSGDVFVRHWEGKSFGERKASLMAEMLEVFVKLHPDLGANDREFELRDPTRPLRESLDIARLARLLAGATRLPCAEEHCAAGMVVPGLLFAPGTGRTRLVAPQVSTLASLPDYRLPDDIAALNATLARLDVTDLSFEDEASLERFAALTNGKPMDLGLRARLGIAAGVG